MSMSPALSKATPHKSAVAYRESRDPTLIRIGADWLSYDESGAYLLIDDDTMQADVSKFLIASQVSYLDAKTQKVVRGPFNPKQGDVNEVYNALARLCHREVADFKPPCWLDRRDGPDPRGIIVCKNGLLDVTTRTLHPHTPEFFTRSALPINYDAFPQEPAQFLKFLSEAMGDRQPLIDLVQEIFGYLITGDTEQEAVFYLLGKSRGGKGTLMKIITALVGDRNMAAVTIQGFADKYWAAPLADKSLALITDLTISNRQDVKQAANNINMLSGRDPIPVRRMYKEPVTRTLPTRILMAGNFLPDFGEHAPALANRLKIVPFDVSFLGREDRTLARRIIDNELAGILVWALDGLSRLLDRGYFVEPADSTDKKRVLVRLANPVLSFIEECCIVESGASVTKGTLYQTYRGWCEACGIKAVLALKDFAEHLYETVPGSREFRPRDGGKQVPHFAGLRMMPHVGAVSGTMPAGFDFERELTEFLDLGTPASEAIEAAKAARRLH
jgi:putative DNA primase/helicase